MSNEQEFLTLEFLVEPTRATHFKIEGLLSFLPFWSSDEADGDPEDSRVRWGEALEVIDLQAEQVLDLGAHDLGLDNVQVCIAVGLATG